MTDGQPHDLGRLLSVLDRHGVEYLIVGGVAAIAYGAARPTQDVDCVVRRDRANLERLAAALRELDARLRVGGLTDDEARLLPLQLDATTLETAGMTTWMTDAGPFDVLAGLESADGRLIPFEELIERSTVIRGGGFGIRAASLDDIITAKERAGRPRTEMRFPSSSHCVISRPTSRDETVSTGHELSRRDTSCPDRSEARWRRRTRRAAGERK